MIPYLAEMARSVEYQANQPMAEAFEALFLGVGLSEKEFALALSTDEVAISSHQVHRWRHGRVILPASALVRAAVVAGRSLDDILKRAPEEIRAHASSDARLEALESEMRQLRGEWAKVQPALELIVGVLGQARGG